MKQYLNLLQAIKKKGTHKPPARSNMPGSQSLFGYQFRHNLQDGFPLLTTKKMYWKGIVIELLWFLRGDTNIKYLLENGVHIWDQDAYNYYSKWYENRGDNLKSLKKIEFDNFIEEVKKPHPSYGRNKYKLGDCGYQYGRIWRNWGPKRELYLNGVFKGKISLDQIATVIISLKNNPQSRRHLITAIDPIHQDDLALYWCHALFQFNARPLTFEERIQYVLKNIDVPLENLAITEEVLKENSTVPKYYLDCQLYQRSADVFLGVPFNLASYALLTHIIAGIVNMIPGEFIHTFGDVHIYDNHREAVEEQLERDPLELPKLIINKDKYDKMIGLKYVLDDFVFSDFKLENYNHLPKIYAELKTGLKI